MANRSTKTVLAAGLLFGAFGVPLACPVAARDAPAERLIPEEGAELFEPASVLAAEDVVRWPLRSLADLAQWTITGATVTEGAAGLIVRATGPKPRLERVVSFNAAAVDALQVEGAASARWGARVFWQRAGERFEAGRSVAGDQDRSGHPVTSRHEMALAMHPNWTGQIVRLRVDLVAAPGQDLPLDAIVAVRYRPDPAAWERATRRPWKAKLLGEDVGDVRNALLAPRGRPISHPISGRLNAVLRFDYGVQGRPAGRLCFTVRAAPSAGEPLDLFARCLEPGDANRWISARADLAALAGRDARLLFEVAGDAAGALPFWGNPEILAPAAAERPNVVLISVDTLRADRLSLHGYRRPTSPRLDRWARERAVAFEEAIAGAPWTIPSHVSMLSGLSPLRHGVNYVQSVPSDLLMLAELLRARGWATLAVTGGGFVAPWVGLHQGFDRYTYWRNRRGPRGEAELASDVDLARGWLREVADRPFFLFFHTYEVHAPYLAREPFFSRFNESGIALPTVGVGISGATPAADNGFVSVLTPIWGNPSKDRPLGEGSLPYTALPLLDALYDSGVAYMDQEVGRLLDALSELDLDRRTLVILTADHGEALGEEGLAGHAYLYDFNLRVPLLLALPNGQRAGQRVSGQVQSIDIVPTVLDVLGLPALAVDGRSLLPVLSGDTAGPNRSWSYAAQTNHGIALRLADGVKYVFNNDAWAPAHGQEKLLRIDRRTGAEREDTGGAEQRSRLRRELFDHYATDGPPALAVTAVNHFDVELRGRIAARTLQLMQVKALEPPPRPLIWNRKGVEFTIPAGRRVQFFLEGGFDDELRISVRARTPAGEVRAEQRIRPDAIGPRAALRVGAGGEERWGNGALPPGASGVELAWRGRTRAPQSRPLQRERALGLPDDVREQLRALGYEQ